MLETICYSFGKSFRQEINYQAFWGKEMMSNLFFCMLKTIQTDN